MQHIEMDYRVWARERMPVASSNEILLHEIEEELHDLCQPLTVLRCRLDVGKSDGSPQGLRDAVDGALDETTRLMESIRRMRERVSLLKAAECIQGCQDDLQAVAGVSKRGV